MARLGTETRPLRVRLRNQEDLEVVSELCEEAGWKFIATLDPSQEPDVSEINQVLGLVSKSSSPLKIGRNDPCSCGSGKKYKKCCWQKASGETSPKG
jgi:SWIM/SEC-C metal-binding protein